MAQWHGISRRKTSGGRRVQARGKRKTEISSEKQFALVGEPKRICAARRVRCVARDACGDLRVGELDGHDEDFSDR